jgi:uncharacterized oxidoreductase
MVFELWAIVNISLGFAFTPLATAPVYSTTEAAIHSLSLSMGHQLRSTQMRVFEIAPPMVATTLSGRRRSAEEIEFCRSAEEAAQGTVDALRRDRYEAALGAVRRAFPGSVMHCLLV